jgi:hypothetical protein
MKSQEAEALRLFAEMHLTSATTVAQVDYAKEPSPDARHRERDSASRCAAPSADAYPAARNLTRARAKAEGALQWDSGRQQPSIGSTIFFCWQRSTIAKRACGAEPRLRAALAIADQVGTRGSRIDVALAEAHLADAAGNPQRVLRALRGAGSRHSGWRLRRCVGDERACRPRFRSPQRARLGRRRRATRSCGGRPDARHARSETLRSTYVADRADVYSDLAIALLRLGRPTRHSPSRTRQEW